MAKFNAAWLIGKRQFRSLTGITPDIFRTMVGRLRPHWQQRIVASKNRAGRPWGVGDLEDHLLVMLILYRCAVTQDFLGCLYQVDIRNNVTAYTRSATRCFASVSANCILAMLISLLPPC